MYQNKSDQSNLNPKAPIYVVTGAAGSHELHEPFTRPQPEWSAFRSNSFGYSKIKVYNSSHLRWQQIQTDPMLFGPDLYGRVIDDAWIVQEKHGPSDNSVTPLLPRTCSRAMVVTIQPISDLLVRCCRLCFC